LQGVSDTTDVDKAEGTGWVLEERFRAESCDGAIPYPVKTTSGAVRHRFRSSLNLSHALKKTGTGA
jgi:hypothetical protein